MNRMGKYTLGVPQKALIKSILEKGSDEILSDLKDIVRHFLGPVKVNFCPEREAEKVWENLLRNLNPATGSYDIEENEFILVVFGIHITALSNSQEYRESIADRLNELMPDIELSFPHVFPVFRYNNLSDVLNLVATTTLLMTLADMDEEKKQDLARLLLGQKLPRN